MRVDNIVIDSNGELHATETDQTAAGHIPQSYCERYFILSLSCSDNNRPVFILVWVHKSLLPEKISMCDFCHYFDNP